MVFLSLRRFLGTYSRNTKPLSVNRRQFSGSFVKTQHIFPIRHYKNLHKINSKRNFSLWVHGCPDIESPTKVIKIIFLNILTL